MRLSTFSVSPAFDALSHVATSCLIACSSSCIRSPGLNLSIERSSQRFQSPSLRLTLQPSSLRTFCRLRRSSFLAGDGDALIVRSESREGLRPILLLAPILLGLDGNHALS